MKTRNELVEELLAEIESNTKRKLVNFVEDSVDMCEGHCQDHNDDDYSRGYLVAMKTVLKELEKQTDDSIRSALTRISDAAMDAVEVGERWREKCEDANAIGTWLGINAGWFAARDASQQKRREFTNS